MAEAAPGGHVMPNFRTPRLVGIFNVLFGAQIVVCGLCMGGYTLTLPLWGRAMNQVQRQAERQVETAKKAELEALDAQEKQAKTDEEREAVAGRRKEIGARPKVIAPGMMDFSKMGMDDPVLIKWTWLEVLTGLVLNVMLLASGIGLLHWRPWGRSLGVWTAVLKLLRLALVYGFFVVSIVPTMSQKIGAMVGEMMVQQQAAMGRAAAQAPPTEMFVRIYTVTYSAMGVGMIALGAIYPLLLLWFLTRPGVKLACSGAIKPPKEPNQPW